MRRFIRTVLLGLTIACMLPTIAWAVPSSGGPHLWLSTDPTTFDEGGTGYIGSNSDPWLTDSYLTNNNPFTLYIYNAAKNKGIATDVQLLLAIHDGEAGSITVDGTSYNSFANTVLPTEYGSGNHGVYAPHDGRYALTTMLGNIGPESSISVDISWAGFSQVHFDVISSNGFYNPPSHDATGGGLSTPEPTTFLLMGSGLVGLAAYRWHQGRRWTKQTA